MRVKRDAQQQRQPGAGLLPARNAAPPMAPGFGLAPAAAPQRAPSQRPVPPFAKPAPAARPADVEDAKYLAFMADMQNLGAV